MIEFEKIIILNFMSVGNAPLEIDYNKSKSTLVTATNGSGKSSVMMDSLCFALYGRPYRAINKPQLINSVNGKQCVVELHFKVNKSKYIVKRGIKPAMFEIHKNGKMINQDAAAKDYQKVLESNILKMNFRTFTQVVIMGSGNYVPFMRLTSAQRREFIEDILDIRIFSLMNQLLKQYAKDTEESEREIRNNISLAKEKFKLQESFIKTLESEKENRNSVLQLKIEELQKESVDTNDTIVALSAQVSALETEVVGLSKIKSKLAELTQLQDKIQRNIDKHIADKEFYASIETCPTCHQSVEDSQRLSIIKGVDDKLSEFDVAVHSLEKTMLNMRDDLAEIQHKQSELFDLQTEISSEQNALTVTQKLIHKHQLELSELMSNSTSVDLEKAKLKKISREIVKADKDRKEVVIQKEYNEAAASLLKDSGIKTKIIKQYIPVFNKLINSYLQQLDLFVSFEIDENFSETVKSRHRDAFTYQSFSEGEKQKIDLAMLFTFRDIARMKNAINVNLLIMDEVLDQSLDAVGVDNFFNIIDGLSSSNLFVISHRENMADKFETSLHLTKRNNFTVLDK